MYTTVFIALVIGVVLGYVIKSMLSNKASKPSEQPVIPKTNTDQYQADVRAYLNKTQRLLEQVEKDCDALQQHLHQSEQLWPSDDHKNQQPAAQYARMIDSHQRQAKKSSKQKV